MTHPSTIQKSLILKDLSETIRAVEHRGALRSSSPSFSPIPTSNPETGDRPKLSTGWPPAPSLPRGSIHEWIGLAQPVPPTSIPRPRRSIADGWTPPCGILVHLAHCAAAGEVGGVVLWVGRCIRPHAAAVRVGGRGGGGGGEEGARGRLLARSILIDPPDTPSRLWAIDLALRSPAVAAVIADGSGLDMAALRRLQLAAEAGLRAGGGGVGLLARPPDESKHISAAATRWLVQPAPSPARVPRWSIRLLRARGVLHAPDESAPFEVEWHRASCRVVVPAAVVHGPGQAPPAPGLALRTA